MTLQTLIKEEAEEMSDDGSIIPISDEQAKLGQEIIKAFSGLGTSRGTSLTYKLDMTVCF